jgi:hypothetical protein
MRFSPRQSLKLLKSKKAGTLIGALMILIGLGAFAHVLKITWDERALKNWVPHLAQVERAAINTHVNDKGGKSYTIDVIYSFDWEGRAFKGMRYRLHDKASPHADETDKVVTDLLRTQQDGGQYPIFVNPKNPAQSAILNTVHPKAKSSSLFLGFLFSILGYFTGFKGTLSRKRPRA